MLLDPTARTCWIIWALRTPPEGTEDVEGVVDAFELATAADFAPAAEGVGWPVGALLTPSPA